MRAVDDSAWPAFTAVVEGSNGLFGGCWCVGKHREPDEGDTAPKRECDRVRAGAVHAHAAVVFGGGAGSADACTGYGSGAAVGRGCSAAGAVGAPVSVAGGGAA